MKYSAPILAGLVLALGGGVLFASAEISATYTPLAPLPLGEGGSTPATYTLTNYLTGAIKLLVAVAGALAIIVLIIGGTQYVAAGINPSAKGDAKDRIWNALIGLALVLTSYLILNSIDPRLVQFNLTLPRVGAVPTTPGTITASPTVAPTAGAWPDDAVVRSQFTSNGISVTGTKTSAACTTVGQKGCTSVYNLPSSAISGVIALKKACGNCSVTITGGTEWWEHKTHGSSTSFAPVVDIDNNSKLDAFIEKGRTPLYDQPCGIRSAPHYYLKGAYGGTYVDEGSHWHVCY